MFLGSECLSQEEAGFEPSCLFALAKVTGSQKGPSADHKELRD